MKNTSQFVRLIAFTVGIILFVATLSNAQRLVVPPNPGSLASVEHLTQSDLYTVEVKRSTDANYTRCFVYKSDNYFVNTYFGATAANPGLKRPQQTASFTNFSFENTAVDVRITCNFTASSVKIRPLNYGVNFSQTGNVITFTLSSPKKLSVEVNDRKNPLFLFADMPDVSNTNATYYYGPGVHNIGQRKVLNSGESVYVAGGAVVEGSFVLAYGSTNISIKGRGILSMGEWPHTSTDVGFLGQNTFIKSSATAYLTMEGVILANGTGFTISIQNGENKTHHNQFRNIKMVHWNGNTDGIWFDGDNHVIDDCFIFNNDDIVTTKGSNNCTISNLVVWGGIWGRLFYQTEKSSSNLRFENINVIGKDGGPELILLVPSSNTITTLTKFTFKNLRVEEHPKTGSYNINKFLHLDIASIKSNGTVTGPGKIQVKSWLFEDVTIDDKNPDEGDLYGNAASSIDSITFRRFKLGGTYPTTLAEANMDKNAGATHIIFETPPVAPSPITASNIQATRATLTWTDNATNETNYVLDRRTATTGYQALTTLGANVETFTDFTLSRNTTYYYRLSAKNAFGQSDYRYLTATFTTPNARLGAEISTDESDADFTISPNPSDNQTIILSMTYRQVPGVDLTALDGRPVTIAVETPDAEHLRVKPLACLATGTYIVTVRTGAVSKARRVVIH